MEYIDKNEEYKLVFDEEQVEDLLKNLLKDCSVRKETRKTEYLSSWETLEDRVSDYKNYIGQTVYANIRDIECFGREFGMTFDREDFTSDKLCAPELARFLLIILDKHNYCDSLTFLGHGSEFDYDKILSRDEIHRKEILIRNIKRLDSKFSKNIDVDFEKAKEILKELTEVCNTLDAIPDFDLDLLSNYYDKVLAAVEKIPFEKRTDYKRSLLPTFEKKK